MNDLIQTDAPLATEQSGHQKDEFEAKAREIGIAQQAKWLTWVNDDDVKVEEGILMALISSALRSAVEAERDRKDKDLVQTPSEQVAWRFRIGMQNLWSYAEAKSDAEWLIKQSGIKEYELQPLFGSVRTPGDRTGWLIENARTEWWDGRKTGMDAQFTSDASEAMRFAREEDAERARCWLLEPIHKLLRSTKHVWTDGAQVTAP